MAEMDAKLLLVGGCSVKKLKVRPAMSPDKSGRGSTAACSLADLVAEDLAQPTRVQVHHLRVSSLVWGL